MVAAPLPLPALDSTVCLASPKSSTFTCPCVVTMTFDGLRSRWTTPRPWAVSSAWASSWAMSTIWRTGSRFAAGGDLQRLALDVLHDDERAAVGVADLENLADERMVERRGGERFAPQALACDEVLFVVRMEPLDRDAPFELGVLGEKDLAHAAGAERGVDAVPAGEQIGHRQPDNFFDPIILGVQPRLVKTMGSSQAYSDDWLLWTKGYSDR